MVKHGDNVRTLANRIVALVAEGTDPTLRAIAAGAVNQAVKGIAVARTLLAKRGLPDVAAYVSFDSSSLIRRAGTGGDEEITVMVLSLRTVK